MNDRFVADDPESVAVLDDQGSGCADLPAVDFEDHVGRAVCHDGGTTSEGWGLFEHGALGRHDPSGFADWLTVAP